MAFLESFSGIEEAICSVMNHSGSAMVPAKPAILFRLAWEIMLQFREYSQGQRLENRKYELRNEGKDRSHFQRFNRTNLLCMRNL